MVTRLYITLFDSTQFRHIVDLTDADKLATWDSLSGKRPVLHQSILELITEARRCRDQGTEVWTFQSELAQPALWTISQTQPLDFMEAVRLDGSAVYLSKIKEAVQ